MAPDIHLDRIYSLTAQKRFGYTKEQKQFIKEHGVVDPDYVCPPQGGIYQRRHGKNGTYWQRMKFYAPTNPRTPAQQANRAKVAAGWIAYGLLTTEERVAYTERAKGKPLSGGNLFMREYLLTH